MDRGDVELGVTTFAEVYAVRDAPAPSHGQRLREVVAEAVASERAGLAVYGVGEHHRADFAASSPAVVLAAIAGQTRRIALTSAVSVLSSDDPVRVYEDFATLDLLSGGRAELMVGRGSFTESFPLFGLADYDGVKRSPVAALAPVSPRSSTCCCACAPTSPSTGKADSARRCATSGSIPAPSASCRCG